MDLKKIQEFSENELDSLAVNINPGIEYEYAIYYALLDHDSQQYFRAHVLESRPDKDNINNIINNIDTSPLETINIEEAFIATQNDNVGPSDIVVRDTSDALLGFSVKYINDCNLNFTSKLFLDNDVLCALEQEKTHACQAYIEEMQQEYESANHWFRKRKRSVIVDNFIDSIREKTINAWNEKNQSEKSGILEKMVHANSPIDFWIVKVLKSLKLKVNKNPITEISNPNLVRLEKHKDAYVRFYFQDTPIGKIQVKFNNGILEDPTEKGKKTTFIWDHCINNIYMKNGAPFGSWNFYLE